MAEHPTPTTSDADGMPRVVTPRPEEASAVLDLADRAGAADGHPPLSDQTRVLLARSGQLWWGATRGPDGAIAGAGLAIG
ncbi:mycothiol synthase, partial [Micrococcus sp. HSID17245]